MKLLVYNGDATHIPAGTYDFQCTKVDCHTFSTERTQVYVEGYIVPMSRSAVEESDYIGQSSPLLQIGTKLARVDNHPLTEIRNWLKEQGERLNKEDEALKEIAKQFVDGEVDASTFIANATSCHQRISNIENKAKAVVIYYETSQKEQQFRDRLRKMEF